MNGTDNIELTFICYKKEEMDLVETYYDEVLNTYYWYINAYLAYKYWKEDFKSLEEIGELGKKFLTAAASNYLLYLIENKLYQNDEEYDLIKEDLKKIDPVLKQIIKENGFLTNL